MQKVLSILERNVQWIALGLGGLFLLLIVWKYVIEPPVKVEVAGKTYVPGELEKVTAAGPVAVIDRQMKSPVVPKLPKVNFVEPFRAQLREQNGQKTMFPGYAWGGTLAVPGYAPGTGIGDPPIDLAKLPVNELPEAPAAELQALTSGRSVVSVVDAEKVRPKRGAALNAPPPMKELDVDWASFLFTVNGETLMAEFERVYKNYKDKDVRESVWQTMIIDVELLRQEQLPNGQWPSKDKFTVVKPLQITPPGAAPGMELEKRPPFPAEDAKLADVLNYLDWASRNTDLLVRPPFYTWVGGDEYRIPGQVQPVGTMPGNTLVPDPYNMGPGGGRRDRLRGRDDGDGAEPGRRRRTRDGAGVGALPDSYDAGAGVVLVSGGSADPRARGRGDRRTGATGRGRGGAGAYPGGAYPGMGPYGPYGGPGRGGMPYGGMPYGRGIPAPGRGVAPMPVPMPGMGGGPGAIQGKFDVRDVEKIEILAHDDTLKPGKTYRYALRYRLKNPLFPTNGIAPKELSSKFSLEAPISEWTEPVTMNEKVEIFVARAGPTNGPATFNVFVWEEGDWTLKKVEAGAGDAIASTGWTMVDKRKDEIENDTYLLLIDQNGTLHRRDVKGDRDAERHKELLDLVAEGGTRRDPTRLLAGGR